MTKRAQTLKARNQRKATSRHHLHARRYRPRFEPLEKRLLLAIDGFLLDEPMKDVIDNTKDHNVAVSLPAKISGKVASNFAAYIDNDQTLQVTGSEADERIVATVDGDTQAIVIKQSEMTGSNSVTFPLSEFSRIQLNAGDGSDFVNIVDADAALDEHQVTLHLSGGDGDNVVLLSAAPVDHFKVQRLKVLAKASTELQDIAQQIAATTQNGLIEQSKELITETKLRIVDVSSSLDKQITTNVFAPANVLLEQSQTELLDTAHDLLAQLEDLGTRAN